jgi:hypothetical protein
MSPDFPGGHGLRETRAVHAMVVGRRFAGQVPLRGDGAICHRLSVRRPDDHHIPMLKTEVRMSMTEVEAAYTEAAR